MTEVAHQALRAAAEQAHAAFTQARLDFDRHALIEAVEMGADGTPTSRLDRIVEDAILSATNGMSVNLLSEETGWVDGGHTDTLIIDPVDGTGNAAAGIPFCAFTGAIARDGQFVEALTLSLTDGRQWWASLTSDVPAEARRSATSSRTTLEGSIVSLIRPKADPRAFLEIARRADRTRVLGSTALEAALVATGELDAHIDAGSDTHRIVDLAAAVVLVGRAGGAVIHRDGTPIEFTTEITARYSGIVAASAELATEVVELISTTTA